MVPLQESKKAQDVHDHNQNNHDEHRACHEGTFIDPAKLLLPRYGTGLQVQRLLCDPFVFGQMLALYIPDFAQQAFDVF